MNLNTKVTIFSFLRIVFVLNINLYLNLKIIFIKNITSTFSNNNNLYNSLYKTLNKLLIKNILLYNYVNNNFKVLKKIMVVPNANLFMRLWTLTKWNFLKKNFMPQYIFYYHVPFSSLLIFFDGPNLSSFFMIVILCTSKFLLLCYC